MDILICESFKLIICYYVEDIIHLSCVIFTDEHNYAQLTETEDVICDMTPDHSYTLSPPSEVPQTPINSTVNYTSPGTGMYMYTYLTFE